MTNTFTASNGWRIRPKGYYGASVYSANQGNNNPYLSFPQIAALREYFEHKRDRELGRWRDPDNPDRVVYPLGDKEVRVLDETDGIGTTVTAGHLAYCLYDDAESCQAARRYFQAHHEKKPWHDARPGEVWLLTIRGGTPEPGICVDGEFQLAAGYIRVTSEAITAGRRIWPEEEATKC